MEHEMEVQKEDYEKKLFELSSRLESIETGMKNAEEKEEEKNNKDKAQLDELERLREEMSAKLEDVCTKVRVYKAKCADIFMLKVSLPASLTQFFQ